MNMPKSTPAATKAINHGPEKLGRHLNSWLHMVMEGSEDDKDKHDKTRRSRSESEAGSVYSEEDARRPTSKKRRKSSSDEPGSTLQERWDEMFERLRRYKETKGNCNVPNRYVCGLLGPGIYGKGRLRWNCL